MNSTTELLDQLLQDPRFKTWALGEAPEFNHYWKDWEGNDPVRAEILYRAKHVLVSFQGAPLDISEEEVLHKIQSALHKASPMDVVSPTSHGSATTVLRMNWKRFYTVAASVLLLVAASFGIYRFSENRSSTTINITELKSSDNLAEIKVVRNTASRPRYVQLSDGSSVILQQHSEISFPEHFSTSKRVVSLSGEAFFEVKKNKNAPFFVHAGKIVTKVLGTSFRIKAYPDDASIQVVVKTGKVSVFTENPSSKSDYIATTGDNGSITLHPNEQMVFNKEENHVRPEQSQQVPTKSLPIESLSFQYNSTPLKNVLQDFQLAYGIRIVFDEETIKNCSLTAQLGDEPLLQKIEWICTILDATYTFENNQILFNAKPCNLKELKK